MSYHSFNNYINKIEEVYVIDDYLFNNSKRFPDQDILYSEQIDDLKSHYPLDFNAAEVPSLNSVYNEILRITIGRLFRLKAINYEHEQIQPRKHFGKNIFDFDDERPKAFQKKYEHIDFLVLNDYITIEEGNKKTDELLKKEYGYCFLVTLGGHYY